MAAADLISLGIGSPAGIRAFILFGLSGSAGASDTTPDAFSGETKINQALGATVTFSDVTPTGYDTATTISVSGATGLYSINGGAYVSSSGTLSPGDKFTPRNTASGSYSTNVDTTITVGGVSAVYRSASIADPGVYVTATYRAGTAMSASGMMGTLFLDDVTAVPAGSYFHGGIAHHPDGTRYVAAWPANNAVRTHGGIGVRQDGAMLILVGGTAVVRHGGIGCTARGEVIAAISAPTIVHNGLGLLADGTLCMSDVS